MMTSENFKTRLNEIEDLLFGFAMVLTRNREDAKDLMQETILRAFRHKNAYKLNTNFKAWITTIMRNNYINEYRKQKTRAKVVTPVKDFLITTENKTAKESTSSAILLKELRSLILRLPKEQRIPFEMHHAGYQYDEISKATNVPIGTIKSRLYFARKKLQNMVTLMYGDTLRRA